MKDSQSMGQYVHHTSYKAVSIRKQSYILQKTRKRISHVSLSSDYLIASLGCLDSGKVFNLNIINYFNGQRCFVIVYSVWLRIFFNFDFSARKFYYFNFELKSVLSWLLSLILLIIDFLYFFQILRTASSFNETKLSS